MSKNVNIFAGRSSEYLGRQIAEKYGTTLGNVIFDVFSDGEFKPSFEQNIRGNSVYIVQSTFPPADNLLELLMLVDAARRASAKHIVAIIPYFGYARQDRKDQPRVPITSKLIANLLTASGLDRLVTLDLHADQIQGFFDIPVDHLYASSVFVPIIKDLGLEDITFASPDAGGTKRAASYAKAFGTDFVMCYKQRSKPNEIEKMALIGNVKNRHVLLLDDMIDTGGTITKAAKLIKSKGAKSVMAFATHAVLSGNAYKSIEKSVFNKIFLTDSIPLRENSSKIEIVPTADLFAQVIHKIENCESVSSLFEF
ncbi:ribose-phosphate pyrophosphokinase [Bacteroidales bacterium OttesenSCG-928-K03]|nr:ribose-phosphate pyrophosphokinase [Odoribacter sp. OttesenSCG-928-L07]MDL2239651.1 ribose-phosphate pyrophosphokinase [Bacteroidales bacterium OttesenSCG-928-L14]MDL2243016.1 ribose-phosphate pyrophosphokinase [Bacteroidales bacterium OttesenSCG-928-K03]